MYRIVGDLLSEHVDGVVADDPDIMYVLCIGVMDQVADAGAVDFDADKIILWLVDSLLQQAITVAKTYLDDGLVVIAEQCAVVQRLLRKIDAIILPVIFQRILLCVGETTLAQDKAFYRPAECW